MTIEEEQVRQIVKEAWIKAYAVSRSKTKLNQVERDTAESTFNHWWKLHKYNYLE